MSQEYDEQWENEWENLEIIVKRTIDVDEDWYHSHSMKENYRRRREYTTATCKAKARMHDESNDQQK